MFLPHTLLRLGEGQGGADRRPPEPGFLRPSVGRREDHEPYVPCSVDGFRNLDYPEEEPR